LLLLTAAFLAVHQRLPIRQLVGAVIAVPVVFLLTGLLRALWGLRETSGTNARTALRALGVWFALSWVVTLACMRGLVRPKAVFLRTPKRKEGGQGTLLQALSASKVESGLAILGILFFNAQPAGPVRQADLPPLGRVAGHQTKPLPATGPVPVSSPQASPSPSPSALASPNPSPKKSP